MRVAALVAATALVLSPAARAGIDLFELQADTSLQLADAEEILERLRMFLWNASDDTTLLRKDYRGRSAGEDMNDVVLAEPARQHLDTAMTAARTQIDAAAVRRNLDEIRDRLINQRDRIRIVANYWILQDIVGHHAELLAAAVADSGPQGEATRAALATSRHEIFEARQRALAAAETGPLSVEPAWTAQHRAIDALNTRRTAWIASLGPGSSTVMPLLHTTPCGPAVEPDHGKPSPSLGETGSSEPFYTAEAKRQNVQGNVVVRATVTASGCLVRSEVAGTSGAPELDDAALKFADTIHYRPGFDGTQAVGGSFLFRVRFQLFEDARQ